MLPDARGVQWPPKWFSAVIITVLDGLQLGEHE